MFIERMKNTIAHSFGCRPHKGHFGIEIETEGVGLPEGVVTAKFVGKPDGSLRNGMEYVSSVLTMAEVSPRVEELRQVLLRVGSRVQPTYRSSTHIHYNMVDRSFRDVLGMMVLWSLIEPTVFRLMPPGRDGSLFCVSSYDSGELPNYIDRFCKMIGDSFERGFDPRGKYSSLNVSRLGDLGTLEYRVFPSSIDGHQIEGWCKWIANMSSIIHAEEDHSFLSMVREAEQNPIPFLSEIFGELPLSERDAAEYVDFGARTAYEMARVIDGHLKKKPRKQKKEEVQANPVPFPPDANAPLAPLARRRFAPRFGAAGPARLAGVEAGQRPVLVGRERPRPRRNRADPGAVLNIPQIGEGIEW